MNKLASAPTNSIRWYPKLIFELGFFLANHRKIKLTTKPNKSVTKWKASLMTEIECERYPPTNYPVIKTKDMMITIISFLKLAEESYLGGGL